MTKSQVNGLNLRYGSKFGLNKEKKKINLADGYRKSSHVFAKLSNDHNCTKKCKLE